MKNRELQIHDEATCVSLLPWQIEEVYGEGKVSENYAPAFPHSPYMKLYPRQTSEEFK